MADKCFGIYIVLKGTEKVIYNLSMFNILTRNRIKEFMYGAIKEVLARTEEICDIDIALKFNKDYSMVGSKYGSNACFIFTIEPLPHCHLILLAKSIMLFGMEETIEENFNRIKTDLKCKEIEAELSEIKTVMIDNIDKILKRGERLEDLVDRTQHLSDSSKKFYETSKKLNKCCTIC